MYIVLLYNYNYYFRTLKVHLPFTNCSYNHFVIIFLYDGLMQTLSLVNNEGSTPSRYMTGARMRICASLRFDKTLLTALRKYSVIDSPFI